MALSISDDDTAVCGLLLNTTRFPFSGIHAYLYVHANHTTILNSRMDRKSQTAVELNLSISWTKLTEYSFIFPNGDSKVKVSFTYDQNHNLAYLIGSVVLTGDYNISQ